MANHMKEVAKMLGVKIGEAFVCDNGFKYMFTEKGVVSPPHVIWGVHMNGDFEEEHHVNVLMALLNGVRTIVPKPWKPAYHERYYSIGPGGVLEPGDWMNDFLDVALYKLGNCYRTVEEAEANKEKWIEFYNSDKTLEV